MPEPEEDALHIVGDLAVRTAFSQAVKHTTDLVVPGLGTALGQAANTGYKYVPPEVKAGAGLGGFLSLHMGSHMIAAGTTGSIAAGTATVAAFLPFVAIGAAIGGAFWLFREITK